MDIGKERPAIVVEPVEDPFAPAQPLPEAPEPVAPVEQPDEVPARS